MLSLSERPRPIASRIQGRAVLLKRLRRLLLATHRFGRGRARTPEDVAWAGGLLDALYAALGVAEARQDPER
jgi:hypothetical protein